MSADRAIAIVERALFGTEDGGLLNDDDASIPVGEFRRLLHEEASGPLALLIAGAEKRGAEKATAETIMGGQRYAVAWALRRAAEDWRRNRLMWDDPDEETNTDLRVARSLDQRADRIQAGGNR